MDMTKILLTVIKIILNMKFGWLILIVVGVIFGLSIIKNIMSGSFNVAKFAGGFNPFVGSVQGKLIYYGLMIILALGLYHQLTRATFDTDYTNTYKNNVHHNEEVTIDQSQHIDTPEDALLIGIKIFGFKIGISAQATSKPATIIDNTQVQKPKETITVVPEKVKEEVKKLNPISAPLRWIGKLFQ